ncbi:MAG TPA: phytoene desaturase family protein [Ilumatobacter sp.]|nr:phytoene desaturase family protein [Ilumatobacter sp.]
MRAIVIGAGMGGLATSIRLAAAGHDVTVLERTPVVGGKLATLHEQGYTFELGPTLLTMPHLYDELFALTGKSLADEVDLVRLDRPFRYVWGPPGTALDVFDDDVAFRSELEAFASGAGDEWDRFRTRAASIWATAERTFMAGPMGSPWSFARRLRNPLDLARIDGNRTLAKSAAAHFTDPRLAQMVGRYATYSGSSPYQVPATLACIAHIEREFGCWHVSGGLGQLRDAVERLARHVGVDIRVGVDVGRVLTDHGQVAGVELADGGVELADVVVANVDAMHLYRDLLPLPKVVKELEVIPRSSSAFVVCAAVTGRTENIAHHNVWFSRDDRMEFRQLELGQAATDPTIYACVSTVTDPSMAPRDTENWYILVNLPPAVGVDRKLMTAAVLNRLAERGVDLRSRIQFTRTLIPADFEVRYRAIDGAIYGTSSNGKKAAFQRPSNIGPVDGLYLVGGSSHPGGGLPMVATSARIVADLVADRHG